MEYIEVTNLFFMTLVYFVANKCAQTAPRQFIVFALKKAKDSASPALCPKKQKTVHARKLSQQFLVQCISSYCSAQTLHCKIITSPTSCAGLQKLNGTINKKSSVQMSHLKRNATLHGSCLKTGQHFIFVIIYWLLPI